MLAALASFPAAVRAQAVAELPAPSRQPLAEAPGDDPLLALERNTMPAAEFRSAIGAALARSPLITAGRAGQAEAAALRREARSALFPSLDVAMTGNQSIARNFSNDPTLIVERTRPDRRVDANASMQQLLFDFGAASSRIAAAAARIESATAETEQTGEGVTLRAIGAWYDLFAYGALVSLSEAYLRNEKDMRSAIERRIRQGFSAPVERARVESAIAEATLRLEQARRAHGNARARYSELFGAAPEVRVQRSPPPALAIEDREQIADALQNSPAIRGARASARAAKSEAKAARADTLPVLTAGIDAGRYGVFEGDRNDYDVRGRVVLRFRLGGAGRPRAAQAQARAEAAAARAEAIEDETAREARIALSEVEAQQAMLPAYRANYLAARTTRDAVFERFRVSRGTLFDTLDAEERLFNAASDYIRAVSESDTAGYVLLARTGQLNETLGLVVPGMEAMP
jgi:adhesin transport system outer membrane protein